jgi:hypothetical protein
MNTKYLSVTVKVGVGIVVATCGTCLQAATATMPQTLGSSIAAQNEIQTVAFSDSKEAGMLRQAYLILETGDHDYKGHRVKAMHQIEAAASLLGMNLHGDAKDKQSQSLSDAKLREARGLLENVLNSSEVKNEKHVSKHINEAIEQINTALSIR